MQIDTRQDKPISFERSYPGISPQLMARTRQLWSAKGLDLDEIWNKTIVRFRGFQSGRNWVHDGDSGPIDNFFMFDQAVMWVASLHASATAAENVAETGLSAPQWAALRALTFRMIEQLDAIRLLFLTDLPTPSMQIARSLSEDVDMALAFVSRPKLAKRFVECGTIEEANEFWRRHIAGGRAYKAVSEQLYRAGLELNQSEEYCNWRRQVQTILSAAVHTSYRSPAAYREPTAPGRFSETGDCLYFVTLRLQEMCAYSHGLCAEFSEDLSTISRKGPNDAEDGLQRLTPAISQITMDQLRWTLDSGSTDLMSADLGC
ncbi:hypothetical protein [Ruegeria lacuscaerulensis]|uniref:hypothetical protein n=1 Tax=Ruegeria lacuscaerulensis TaxID=55218 RepID=UPI00147EE915|nr:hypothetical protein [Ruegeria lacuscaerulensis]